MLCDSFVNFDFEKLTSLLSEVLVLDNVKHFIFFMSVFCIIKFKKLPLHDVFDIVYLGMDEISSQVMSVKQCMELVENV